MRGCVIAGLALSQPAIAETVVVKCTITSGNPGHVIISVNAPFGPAAVGETVTYKIGDGRWLAWSARQQKWERDYCTDLGIIHKVDEGVRAQCSFTASRFEAAMTLPGVLDYKVAINRETGALTTSEYGPPNEYNGGADNQSAGTCEKAAEPKPPPPPPTKF